MGRRERGARCYGTKDDSRLEDDDPGSGGISRITNWSPFLLLEGESSALWGFSGLALLVLAVSVAAGAALRNFRWPRLEKVVGGEENLQRYEEALRREQSILDGLLVTRIVSSALLLLIIFSWGDLSAGEFDTSYFFQQLGIFLLIFLLGIHGIVRGFSRAMPERTLVLLLPLAKFLATLFRPVVWLMDVSGQLVTRLFGLQVRESEQVEARDDILDAVSEGERDGAIDDEEREMIENIMEVKDRAVTQVMTPRTSVFTIPLETPSQEALSRIASKGHSRVPVVGESIDDVKGILYAKDILAVLAERDGPLPPIAEMMRPALFIPETKRTSELLSELRMAKVHLAVVVDEYGGMAGIITVEDIIEEIVGEIEDEHDANETGEHPILRVVNDREAEVPATVFIDDLNEAMHLELPEGEDYDTVAGFLFTQMGRVPAVGEMCEFEDVAFEILQADERRIHLIKVTVGEPQ